MPCNNYVSCCNFNICKKSNLQNKMPHITFKYMFFFVCICKTLFKMFVCLLMIRKFCQTINMFVLCNCLLMELKSPGWNDYNLTISDAFVLTVCVFKCYGV